MKVIVGEGTVILLKIIHYANSLVLLLRLTFLAADTHTIVQNQVYMGQLCHHASSFKERLKRDTKQNFLQHLFQRVNKLEGYIPFFDVATDL